MRFAKSGKNPQIPEISLCSESESTQISANIIQAGNTRLLTE